MSSEVASHVAPVQVPTIEPWPLERLREGLSSDDHNQRVEALAMSVQPTAEVDECVGAIIACVEVSRADPIACQLAAVALSNVKRESEKTAAANCLASLCSPENAPAVRTFAAHGLAQLGQIPSAAWPNLAAMLFVDDGTTRQVALRAVTPFAVQGAAFIAQAATFATPVKWTTEGLAALAHSAGSAADGKQRVEQYVLRSLQDQALVPAGIAGYSALAKLNPDGLAPLALAKIAASEDDVAALAAINALAKMGESGKSAIPGLIQALVQTEKPEREEAICRALLPLQLGARDVPLPRVLKRVEGGPDRAVAAHCILLSLHAKSFAAASNVVAARHAVSAEALQRVLDEVHHQLVGTRLSLVQATDVKSKTN